MSSFVHCQAFQHGTFSTCKRSIIWDVFESKAHWGPEGWSLWYGDEPAGVLYLDEEDEVTGFSILRAGGPCLDDFVMLAAQIPSLIYWSEGGCAIANPAFLPGIPDWLLKALRTKPTIVHNGDELGRCLQESLPTDFR
jgi:hypothetical protein